ncbi:hypothetical protein HYV84_05425 [Candidatus Woesearchaeota archaeon]|nr:hypothetical protein [Candidatus Woesearchaeota archaeon]
MKRSVQMGIVILGVSFLLSSLITFLSIDKKIDALQEQVPASSDKGTSEGFARIEIIEPGQAEPSSVGASTVR